MTVKVYQAGLIDAAGDVSPAARLELVGATNPVINGGFDVWQRGTTFTSVIKDTYTADRWAYNKAGAVVHDVLRSTDVPSVATLVPLASYSIHLDVTTADASIAASDDCFLYQSIEGYNWAPFAQKQFTVGFWVKDTITGIHCVAVTNTALDRTCVMEYTVNSADTWEYKTCTFPASPSAGTWNYTTGVGGTLRFALSAGSAVQTTAGAWQTGDFVGTSSIVNSTSSTSNNFKLWGVTMGLGATVAPYWPRSFGQELTLCQRYYQTSYAYGTTVPTSTAASIFTTVSNSIATGVYMHRHQFGVTMRSSPTITIYPYTTVANTGRVSNDAGTDQGASSGTTADGSVKGFAVANQSGSTITLTQGLVLYGWQAVAEL